MSEGLNQITIPDFDDDDLNPSYIPFGHTSAFNFGASSGQESPTSASTPIQTPDRADRSYFHSRGDSVNSEDSGSGSVPFVYSSPSSVTTANSGFSRKASFASFRNAFKSIKTSDPPPVPPVSYPALSNPFSRSTSSLAHTPPAGRRPSVNASPTHGGSHTPPLIGQETKHIRGQSSRSKGQSHVRAQHSRTGSTFHYSDNGSDQSHSFGQGTPPPVPRMPNGYNSRVNTPPPGDLDEDIVIDPRTPSEYALHAVFLRFVSTAEMKIDSYLRMPTEREYLLGDVMGQGVDVAFDDILSTLAQIASKRAKPVVDSILRWKKSQQDSVSGDVIRFHSSSALSVSSRPSRGQDVIMILNDRKLLASTYIMTRGFIAVAKLVSKDGLTEQTGLLMEELAFDQFRRADGRVSPLPTNQQALSELSMNLLGQLSRLRFVSVTDRFLNEFRPLASGQVPKDLDMRYETLVKGIRHIQIKVWPPEAFEEGAEFLDRLSKSFENAHGLRLKITFAETLVQMLHPIGKTAQAEVNDPAWAKAIETIYPRAFNMMNKPRYWNVAYPLAITSLCVAPHEYFLRNWMSCVEASFSKLKDKPSRIPVMNGLLRLIWTYLYRCRESPSTTTAKIELVLKHLFPPNRTVIHGLDENLDPFVYLVHFVLSRLFDYGSEFVLLLMQEQTVLSMQTSNGSATLAYEKINVGLEAALLTAHLIEREESVPSWPSNVDFFVLPPKSDYPSSSDFLPSTFAQKAGFQSFFDRCTSLVNLIATGCARSVGNMSVFDEQWSGSRSVTFGDDGSNFVVRQHVDGNVIIPTNLLPQISLLQLCFTSLPRCRPQNSPLNDVLEMLFRAVMHVEPSLAESASLSLHRFAADPMQLHTIVSRFSQFLFNPSRISGEGSNHRLMCENSRVLRTWLSLVKKWSDSLSQKSVTSFEEEEAASLISLLHDIEAASVFLLSFISRPVRLIATKAVRVLEGAVNHLYKQDPSPFFVVSEKAFPILDLLIHRGFPRIHFDQQEDTLDTHQRSRLGRWRSTGHPDALIRLAESEDEKDRVLWGFMFSSFIRSCVDLQAPVLGPCRDMWIAALSKYHSLIAMLSGVNNRVLPSQQARSPTTATRDRDKSIVDNISVISQWHTWMRVVCCTASSEVRSPTKRDQAHVPLDFIYDYERMATTRGLFRYLTPFLGSDHSIFRDTAVMSVSSFPPGAYSQLLDDLSVFAARHFYDDMRTKTHQTLSARRNRHHDRIYLAVAHIYQLTAHNLKEQRGISKQDILTNVLKFVRQTQAFLSSPEIRRDWQQQRLRRYFCGIVESLFDGLATLKASDRFIPSNTHLTLYRLCEGWCQCGVQSEEAMQTLIEMQTGATAGFTDSQHKAVAIEKFQTETRLLSHAAVGAMASLCQKAFFPPTISSSSPTDKLVSDVSPLDARSTLDRITAMLASLHESVQNGGRKALKSLLSFSGADSSFIREVLRRSFATSRELKTSNCRFFEVIADVICHVETQPFKLPHMVLLGLSNLCSPLVDIRQLAFDILEIVQETKSRDLSDLAEYECMIRTPAPSIYLDALERISDDIAKLHRKDTYELVVQFSVCLPLVQDSLPKSMLCHSLLGLIPWLQDVNLVMEDGSLSADGLNLLHHLVLLTYRFHERFSDVMQLMWSRIIDHSHAPNTPVIIRFLIDQLAKFGTTAMIECGRQIVSFISRTSSSLVALDELCSYMEPEGVLAYTDSMSDDQNSTSQSQSVDFDDVVAGQPKHSFGYGQLAIILFASFNPHQASQYEKHLPLLLHVAIMHVDHRNSLLRENAQLTVFQILRSIVPHFDRTPDSPTPHSQDALRKSITDFERSRSTMFWSEDDTVSMIAPKMKKVADFITNLLRQIRPALINDWGSLALHWGTACSLRAMASHSLQIFRALNCAIRSKDFALLLGRLSNTIADRDANVQSFTTEIILTLQSFLSCGNLDESLLPSCFWCACACLSTPVESEFAQTLELFEALLERLDINDESTVHAILLQKPPNWMGNFKGVQPFLLIGLRSQVTVKKTMALLTRLSKVENPTLVDSSPSRLRDIYTLCLPWCLRDMDMDDLDDCLIGFVTGIEQQAQSSGLLNIARIMTSFLKRRFRTKDDFLRQAAAALRECYSPNQWTEVVTLLLSLVLNQERWLRLKSMQILKVLFQLRETRDPVDKLGSELLMPLLRLLPTELATQALEVLEEPIAISGGLPARHVLRMSMQVTSREAALSGDVFGVTESSGWSIARPQEQREICRANVIAVFETRKTTTRPSLIEFEPEEKRAPEISEVDADGDLGDLVQNLHELSTFFQEEAPQQTPPPIPNHQLEARVAAILAKSDTPILDSPRTPFTDTLYRAGGYPDLADSDEDSGSDVMVDSFAYDSVISLPLNGRHGRTPKTY